MPTTKINGKLWQIILVVVGMAGGFAGAIYFLGGQNEKLDHAVDDLDRLTMTVEAHTKVCSPAALNAINEKITDIHDDLRWLRSYVIGELHPSGPERREANNGDVE